MIISASRRTDIPAFYSDWFFNRLKEGFCHTPNPRNPYLVSQIPLTPDYVDAFVFWTKNPFPMLERLHLLKEFPYYFHYTITSYSNDIETNLPRKKYLVETFKRLSNKIGKERTIWRYDPIFLNSTYTIDYHIKYFEILCKNLAPYTTKVIISFLSIYRKNKLRCDLVSAYTPTKREQYHIITELAKICQKYNIFLELCAVEFENTQNLPVYSSHCIDVKLINSMRKTPIRVPKDSTQREGCGCAKSYDIGMYNSCYNGCLYCYASYKEEFLAKNKAKVDPNGTLLLGKLSEHATIKEKNIFGLNDDQLSLL